MNSMKIFLIVISALLHSGFALECYKCNSTIDANCADEPIFNTTLNSGSIVNCDGYISLQPENQSKGQAGNKDDGLRQAVFAAITKKGSKCLKAIVKNKNGNHVTIRDCSLNIMSWCHVLRHNIAKKQGDKIITCKDCTGDMCNSARGLGITFMLLILPTIVYSKKF